MFDTLQMLYCASVIDARVIHKRDTLDLINSRNWKNGKAHFVDITDLFYDQQKRAVVDLYED